MRTHFHNYLLFWFTCIVSLHTSVFAQNTSSSFIDREDVQAWVTELSQRQNIPQEYLLKALAAAERKPSIEKIVRQVPGGAAPVKSWSQHRARMIDATRIDKGLAFWQQYQTVIQGAADRYGIPPEVIVAIIGIETLYGENMGNFRVIDALSTLAFHYPPENTKNRSVFFQQELASFLEQNYRQQTDPLSIKGSYAGAMGYSQFMPSSIAAYAEDGNGNQAINLTTEVEDAIWSTARFLSLHGWVPNTPIYVPNTSLPSPEVLAPLVDGGITPKQNWKELAQAGIYTDAEKETNEILSKIGQARSIQEGIDIVRAHWSRLPMGVIDLPDTPKNTVEYRIALPNFFAITHYNRSYFYAAVVSDLAQTLARKRALGRAS